MRVLLLGLVQIEVLYFLQFVMHHALPASPRVHVPSSGPARHLLPHQGNDVPEGEGKLDSRLRSFGGRCCGALAG